MKKIILSQKFSSSAGEISYDSFGKGSDIVLVHGTPTNSSIWSETLEALKKEYRVHLLDLPGYGASEKFNSQDVRLRSFAKTLHELVEHLDLSKPHLVGHDFGAATILGAHLIEGVEVASLTIIDGVVLSPWGTEFSRHVKKHENIFSAVPSYVHSAVLSAHLDTAVSNPLSSENLEILLTPWLGTEGQDAYYRQVAQYDYEYTEKLEALYPHITIPTLILWGEEDKWVNITVGKRLEGLIPTSIFKTLPEAGHFSMLDTPNLLNKSLKDWISQQ